MSEWWLELDVSASFKEFLRIVEEKRDKRTRDLIVDRGMAGARLQPDNYHALAGEARAFEIVLNIVEDLKRAGTRSQDE